ncbi:unnamed protein product, partial [Prorocentrum cordatum]
ECFTLSWAKIRERRLGELRNAKSKLGRLEKKRAALQIAKGKLEGAVDELDGAAFDRLAAEAVAEKLVPQAQVDQLAKRPDGAHQPSDLKSATSMRSVCCPEERRVKYG